MNPAPAVDSAYQVNPIPEILWGGLICGTMDIAAALVVYGHYGRKPIPLLQGIAAGLWDALN
jgi:hypothetical protein